jgi:hypothetical protein
MDGLENGIFGPNIDKNPMTHRDFVRWDLDKQLWPPRDQIFKVPFEAFRPLSSPPIDEPASFYPMFGSRWLSPILIAYIIINVIFILVYIIVSALEHNYREKKLKLLRKI